VVNCAPSAAKHSNNTTLQKHIVLNLIFCLDKRMESDNSKDKKKTIWLFDFKKMNEEFINNLINVIK